jgi:hypothetical protein
MFLYKLLLCLFWWHIPDATNEEMNSADVILTQSIGRNKDNQPSIGNGILALSMYELHCKFPDKPIIPQQEVALMVNGMMNYAAIACHPRNDPDHYKSSSEWNTDTVVKFQAGICRDHGWSRAIVVTTPLHRVRTAMVMQRYGLEAYFAPGFPWQHMYSDPDADTWGMRGSSWRFMISELGRRLYFLFTGRI